MLGYVVSRERGKADQLLAEAAAKLRHSSIRLAGVVQVNDEFDPLRPCHMDLHVLTGTEMIRISQDLGRHSVGCRLELAGLDRAVGSVTATLNTCPQLLILNKFGKQEAAGRGFRSVIGHALAAGIPVLTAVSADCLETFLRFADGLGHELEPEIETVLTWCQAQAEDTP